MPAGGEISEECALIRAAQEGDLGARRRLFRAHDEEARRFVAQFCLDASQSALLLDEIWAACADALEELDGSRPFEDWLKLQASRVVAQNWERG